MEPKNTSNKTFGIVAGAVVVVAVVAVSVLAGRQPAQQATTAPDQTSGTSPSSTTAQLPPADTSKQSASVGSVYKDGTYSATGSYMSPGGQDQIAVTLTLANDIITSASVTPMPGDHTSSRYQSMFAAGYQQYVVGKDISTVNLTKVSGSSLTPEGFDDALAQIKAQAKA